MRGRYCEMKDKEIVKQIETAMMDRITVILARDEEYSQSVAEEGKVFEWLKIHRKAELSSGYEGFACFL